MSEQDQRGNAARKADISRLMILREILWNPVAKIVWTVVGLWGWVIAFQPADVQEEVTLYRLTHNAWPWWLWALSVCVCLTLLSLYGGVRLVYIERENIRRLQQKFGTTSRPQLSIKKKSYSGTSTFGDKTRPTHYQRYVLHNSGGVVATNARATISIPQTAYSMTLRQPGDIDSNDAEVETTTSQNPQWRGTGITYEVMEFIAAWRKQTKATADMVIQFDVIYWDVAKRFEYRAPHILIAPASGHSRIEPDPSRPEPEPIPLSLAPRVS